MAEQEGSRGFEMADSPTPEGSRAPEPASFTFASLVLSLSTSALLHLGMAPRGEDEGSEPPPTEVNLPMAKQVVDLLEMLREKTKGNLDGEETRLLEQILHDLHLRYLEKKKS